PGYLLFFFFFFFQAEDGIRDFHVTGVQTCALPISIRRLPGSASLASDHGISSAVRRTSTGNGFSRRSTTWAGVSPPPARTVTGRSEERRVGKECRSRWAPNDEEKKREKRAGDNDEK